MFGGGGGGGGTGYIFLDFSFRRRLPLAHISDNIMLSITNSFPRFLSYGMLYDKHVIQPVDKPLKANTTEFDEIVGLGL